VSCVVVIPALVAGRQNTSSKDNWAEGREAEAGMPTHVALRRRMMMEQCEMNCARWRGNKRAARAGSVSVFTIVMRHAQRKIVTLKVPTHQFCTRITGHYLIKEL